MCVCKNLNPNYHGNFLSYLYIKGPRCGDDFKQIISHHNVTKTKGKQNSTQEKTQHCNTWIKKKEVLYNRENAETC